MIIFLPKLFITYKAKIKILQIFQMEKKQYPIEFLCFPHSFKKLIVALNIEFNFY